MHNGMQSNLSGEPPIKNPETWYSYGVTISAHSPASSIMWQSART